LDFADIRGSDAEVLVSSDDYRLSMGGGVSAAIRAAAGNALALDAAKSGEHALGDVVVTTAGALNARYVFHVITIGPGSKGRGPQEVIRSATMKCLELLRPLSVSSIAFPALGTGVAGFSMEDSAVAMSEVVADFLTASDVPVQVSLFLYPRGFGSQLDYLNFYEEFARRAPTLARREKPLTAGVSDSSPVSDGSARTISRLLTLEQERQRLEEELAEMGEDDPGRRQHLMSTLQDNLAQRVRAAHDDQAKRTPSVSVFVSYARADRELRDRLGKQLAGLKRSRIVNEWHDRLITPGDDWHQEIDEQLKNADLILLLLSADFMASEYIMSVEVTQALARHEKGEACVIPVVLKPVDWSDAPFRRFQALPTDGKPVTSWADPEAALLDVAQGVKRAAIEFAARRPEPS
jgi:O-acetyl-ADP-ribose deacetylase (regulator of RNase III)